MTEPQAVRPSLLTGEIGHFGPRALVKQTDMLGYKPGREVVVSSDPSVTKDCTMVVFVPAARPSLRFPLVEEVAAREGIDLWYFDPAKWPERVPVDPAAHLGLPFRKGSHPSSGSTEPRET